MLTRKTNGVAMGPRLSKAFAGTVGSAIDRRTFLKRSGLTAGGIAAASAMSFGKVKKAEAQSAGSEITLKKSVCTHCSVGCGIVAEVKNGVWSGQEAALDHPFNRGSHCAKGASVREHGHGERRWQDFGQRVRRSRVNLGRFPVARRRPHDRARRRHVAAARARCRRIRQRT